MEIENNHETYTNFNDDLFNNYGTKESVHDDNECRKQIEEAFSKRASLPDLINTKFDVREYGVGLVCPTNFGDRTPTLIANLRQCINEAQKSGSVPLKSIIVVSFDNNNKNYDNRKEVEKLLRAAQRSGKIGYYEIVETIPHSTARSVNVGIEATIMHDWKGNPPAFVIQVDDDSRYEEGGLSVVGLCAQERSLDIFSSITERPSPEILKHAFSKSGAKSSEYSDDRFFSTLLQQYGKITVPYTAPNFITNRGVDLGELMFWQGHNEQIIDPNSATQPLTPNENGRGFSFYEASLRVRNIGRAVPESRKGGEGPADYMTLVGTGVWPNHVGVIPVRLFDRNFVSGIETSNIMWGYGDRIRAMALRENGLTPQGIIARDVIDGKVVKQYFPDAPHSISINFPSVLRKHCAFWHTPEGREALSYYDDGSGTIKHLPKHLVDSITRAVIVSEKALREYDRVRQYIKPEIEIYGNVNSELYPCNSNAYTAQSSFLKIGGFINRAICELGHIYHDGSLRIPFELPFDQVVERLNTTVLILDCYSA